jgi:uncharacterized protein YbjT (DUF2867 family)
MKNKKAILIGASGLIGSEILKILRNSDYASVKLLVRRKLDVSDEKIVQELVDFDNAESWVNAFQGYEHVFCSIGTTRSKTPDLLNYRKVDFDIPVNAIKAAEQCGISAFMLVSSVGADALSKNFYLKIKGEVDDVLQAANIPIKGTFRPSLLLGNRKEKRIGEWIARKTMPLFNFLVPSKYKAIQASDVAHAMLEATKKQASQFAVYQYKEIQALLKQQ